MADQKEILTTENEGLIEQEIEEEEDKEAKVNDLINGAQGNQEPDIEIEK